VRRHLGLARVGHSGTLDPAAEGVLLLAINRATRLIRFLLGDKTYRARLTLGAFSSTDDTCGQLSAAQPVPALSQEDLQEHLRGFLGPQLQRPPAFSACHFQGKRLYQYARSGEMVELPPRWITIHEIALDAWGPNHLDVRIVCSAGTYIRSLARDLGEKLGCGAYLSSLERISANGVAITEALDPDPDQWEAWRERVISPERLLAHLPGLELADKEAIRLAQGMPLQRDPRLAGHMGFVRLMHGQGFLGVAVGETEYWRPEVIFTRALSPDAAPSHA
jgi:tRNA pseudouridine55 synthase